MEWLTAISVGCAIAIKDEKEKANSCKMDLKLDSREGFLLATAAGKVSLKEALDIYKKACDFAAEHGFDRILVDCSAVEGELSDMERYELGRTMAEYCLRRSGSLRIATVGKPPTITGFAALVASNRGVAAETFSELHTAIAWLNSFGAKATTS